jgi:hypothetical protein
MRRRLDKERLFGVVLLVYYACLAWGFKVLYQASLAWRLRDEDSILDVRQVQGSGFRV